ncbi:MULTISPECIES: phosphodiesterase [unclassified Knoellia]|uniref:phosphodiesterase n=1 Tax=Knoellia altitudinis TaxID=3404795 RepID=UPI00360D5A29
MQPATSSSAHPRSTAGLVDLVARVAGRALAVAFGEAARLRGTRALHPVGFCGAGSLTVDPGRPSGVVMLDAPGPHPCLVRWSRATGLHKGPDLEGLAVRLQGPAAGDVLVTSTGTGVLTRHVLTVRRRHHHGPLTTVLPLSTARGPLLLRFDPLGSGDDPPAAYRLLVSAPGRPWHKRGRLDITWTGSDCTRRHDPVGHSPAGTWTHPLWAGLREPSYAASRRVRAEPEEPRG